MALCAAASQPLLAQPQPGSPDPDPDTPLAPNFRPVEGPGPGLSLHDALKLPPWMEFSVELEAEPLANGGGLFSSGAWSQQLTIGASFSSGLAKEPSQWSEADHWTVNTQLMQINGPVNYGLNVGAAFPLQSTNHPSGLWLTEATLERKEGLGPLSLKGGLMSLNPDFVDIPILDFYVHSALDNTLNLTVFGLPINPLVAPGAQASLHLGQAGTVQLGAYWLDSQTQLAELFGVDPLQPQFKGSTQLVQWTFTNLPGTKRLEEPIQLGQRRIERQLPHPRLQLGAITSNTDVQGTNRVVYGALSLPLTLPFGLDHRLWAGVNVGLDPSNNSAPLFLSGGWAVQGPMRSRPHDVLALGLGRTSFGPSLASGQSYEGVIELNYNAALSSSLALGPVIQLILNPGGSGDVRSIVAAGLQFELSL